MRVLSRDKTRIDASDWLHVTAQVEREPESRETSLRRHGTGQGMALQGTTPAHLLLLCALHSCSWLEARWDERSGSEQAALCSVSPHPFAASCPVQALSVPPGWPITLLSCCLFPPLVSLFRLPRMDAPGMCDAGSRRSHAVVELARGWHWLWLIPPSSTGNRGIADFCRCWTGRQSTNSQQLQWSKELVQSNNGALRSHLVFQGTVSPAALETRLVTKQGPARAVSQQPRICCKPR